MLDVYYLCAAWCASCRNIKPEFDGLSTEGFHLHWVDIERGQGLSKSTQHFGSCPEIFLVIS